MAASCSTCARRATAVSEQHGRCLLQLWSEERNLIRTVVDVQQRAQCLRLITRRMGAAKPQALELVPTSDRRTPTARDAARRNYQRLLERVLTRPSSAPKWMGCARPWTWNTASVRPMSAGGCCAAPPRTPSSASARRNPRAIDRRHSHAGHSVARLLPPARRWPPAFRRAQGRRSRRCMADDRRAHGMAESRRAPISSSSLSTSAAKNCACGFSRHRQSGIAAGACVFGRRRPIERCQAGIDRLLALVPPSGQRARGDSCRAPPPKWDCCCTGLNLPGCATALLPTPLRAKIEITFGAGANETPLDRQRTRGSAANCSRGSS